jgi:hypothetical protein
VAGSVVLERGVSERRVVGWKLPPSVQSRTGMKGGFVVGFHLYRIDTIRVPKLDGIPPLKRLRLRRFRVWTLVHRERLFQLLKRLGSGCGPGCRRAQQVHRLSRQA